MAAKKARRRVCVDLPEDVYLTAKIMSKAGNTSMSSYVRMAVEDALERRDVYTENVTRKVVSTRKKTVEVMPKDEFDEICRQVETETGKKLKKEIQDNSGKKDLKENGKEKEETKDQPAV